MKRKVLVERTLVNELFKIRNEMDHDLPKAKQMLTNLAHNINKRHGRCFKIINVGGEE